MEPDEHLSVVALHGLAVRDEEIEAVVPPVVKYAGCPGVRWLFPRAPRRSVTLLGGQPARAWYDVSTCDRSQLDEAGIEAATEEICRTVRAERERDRGRRRVVLMGFSQGGALALNAGLKLQDEVDGIVSLASAIPFPERVSPATPDSPPVFLGHGLFDPRVPYRMGRESERLLAAKNYRTEWHTYAYRHSTGRRQLKDISRWLRRNFITAERAQAAPLRGLSVRLPHQA
jgi:phospholipase/carboxylesterase